MSYSLRMNLRQMDFVVAVDRHAHFGRAAAACHVTQPALSMQVARLERELGVRLFERGRGPVRTTDAGRLIVRQARRVLEEVERLREIAGDSEGEVAGELRLGVIPTLGPYLLPRVLPALVRRYPQLRLQVDEMQTDEVVERVAAGELEAGLIATPAGMPGLHETPLFSEGFVAYVSEEHPLFSMDRVRADTLRLEDLWLLTQGHCMRDHVLSLCARRETGTDDGAPLRFESGNLETLRRLVDHGGGLTLLPQLAVAGLGEAERRRIRWFEEPAPIRQVRLVRGGALLKRRAIGVLVEAITTFAAAAGLRE